MTQQQPHAHLARPVHKEPPVHAPNAALMIDFDNVTMGIRSDLQTELKRLLQSEIIRGKVAVQRAYADWRRYPQYIVPLSESSIDLIFAPAYGSNKKNATDIRLAIDALELVFTRPEIGTFILLSGDSDFSSLVLKLKEYGKYVIGVGIRESSSDLLIQNCDEYYSYSELAGFTKESEATSERRDPWELVVEAVKQMTAHNDVMRSDRLKQVMQEIDPNFDEKNAGFSRFSKFVLEAAHRGLITLTKLDSGQFEVALGPQAGGGAATPAARAVQVEEEDRARDGGERRRRRERGEGERRPEAAKPPRSGFRVGEAFGLLKQALGRLGGDEPVTADAVREKMAEMTGPDAEAIEPARFPKLLRQAHDAEIIDLSKQEDGGYAVKLRPGGEVAAPSPVAGTIPSAPTPAPAGPRAVPASRSARFRRGSRGPQGPPPVIPKIGVVEVDPAFVPRVTPAAAAPAPLPATGGVAEEEEDTSGFNRIDYDPGRERSGGGRPPRGRGGRGRRGDGRDGEDRAPGVRGSPGERGERGVRGERGERRPRGGRGGRGGRGRGGGRPRGAEVSHAGSDATFTPAPAPAAPAPPASAESPRGSDAESFWTRVKRGLTGGT
jgi:uncharacterized protein (TIGR00288 family)